jgi:hypothetical protein
MAISGMIGNMNKMRIMILGAVGVILVIAGLAVATIHSSLRGSGLGTVLMVFGFLIIILVAYVFATKRPK